MMMVERSAVHTTTSSNFVVFLQRLISLCWLLLFNSLEIVCVHGADVDDEIFQNNNSDPATDNIKNPYQSGCLSTKLSGGLAATKKKRVCNSDDVLPDAIESGICRPSPFPEYLEIRIFCQDWESVLIETWVLQIILSEIMDVPTTVETGFYDAVVNFYDPQGRYDYAHETLLDVFHSTYGPSMDRGYEIGDCRNAKRNSASNYEECAHMVPEICQSETEAVIEEYVYEGKWDAPQGLGALGMESWFIPKFTAERDPSLTSYLGMAGDHNRQKMVDLFKTPITFGQYCEEVSPTNCVGDNMTNTYDGSLIATRSPLSDKETSRYFLEGVYSGYFMDNDCLANTTSHHCVGHIADYPCSWPAYVWEQTRALNINLESNGPEPGNNGYSLQQMDDIWRAANATKSNVVMQWWTPQALHQLFHGTDAEFTKVTLPTPTQECLRARQEGVDRCAADYKQTANLQMGTCDTLTGSLFKMKVATLFDLTYNSDIPVALQSPGYSVLELFRISEHQLTEIFEKWKDLGDPREAVCEWAVENMDYMNSFIPQTYPREMVTEKNNGGLQITAAVLASLVILSGIITSFLVYYYRNSRSIVLAQKEFLGLLLLGTLSISTAALVMVLKASDAACVAVEWIINVGYTLELVPLLVKINAITRLALAAQAMRRVKLKRRTLFGTVAIISTLVLVFMIIWTVLDPPRQNFEYELTDETNDDGDHIIRVYEVCMSESRAWYFASVGWMLLLLLAATVLAIQMRKVEMKELREARTLAALIYSHGVFMLMRLVTYFLYSVVREDILTQLRSLIFSLDALSTVLIYVMPKFKVSEGAAGDRSSIRTSGVNLHPSASYDIQSSKFKVSRPSSGDEESMMVNKEATVPAEELESLKALLAEKENEIQDLKEQVATTGSPNSASTAATTPTTIADDNSPNAVQNEAVVATSQSNDSPSRFLRVDATGSCISDSQRSNTDGN